MAVLPRNTVDIIEQIVSEMTPDFVIGSKITNPDGTYTLTTTNTYWLHANQDIVIGGNKYTIVDFIINESITIKDINSVGEPVATVFAIPAPLFIHGKTVKASKELAEQKDVFLRLPFIWLYEVLSETTIIDRLNPWGLESTPIIYFMDEAQSENWTSADHKVQILDPVRQMMEYFMFVVESNRAFYRKPDSYDTEARANWGKFVTDKGAVGRFFHDQLSGHKLDFELVASKKACDPRSEGDPCVLGVGVSTTPESAIGAGDGTATANPTNSQGAVNYLWDAAAGNQITQTAVGLSAGTYSVLISDETGCTAQASGTVEVSAVNNALRFNGSNNYVAFTSSINIPLGGDFTICYEFNPDALNNKYVMNGLSGHSIYHRFGNTQYRVTTSTGTSSSGIVLPAVGVCTKAVLRRIGGTMQLFLNGLASGFTAANNGAIQLDFLAQQIPQFAGLLDNVNILSGTGASLAQIAALTAGVDFITVMGSADLQYLMNQTGSDPIAIDTSSNGNNGVLTNYIFTPSPWETGC